MRLYTIVTMNTITISPQLTALAAYIKQNMDFARFARLTRALGNQANSEQLRFFKAVIFERSMETYSQGKLVYVGQEGCDLLVPQLNNARVEMKYVEGALYTTSRRQLRENTGGIKLMNSMGTNTHKTLPANYADYLIYIGCQGAMLFDRATLEDHMVAGGDGITANLPTNRGVLLAGPDVMTPGRQEEVDFLGTLMKFVDSYINSVK